VPRAKYNQVVDRERKKDPAAVKLGRKGGKARATRLSREELSRIGKEGARARWEREKTKKKPESQPE